MRDIFGRFIKGHSHPPMGNETKNKISIKRKAWLKLHPLTKFQKNLISKNVKIWNKNNRQKMMKIWKESSIKRKGIYPESFQKYYKNHKPFYFGKKLPRNIKKRISNKVKNLWENSTYREKVRASHRKKRSKRGQYIQIYVPNHPEANERGYVREHRILMEQKIGRRLNKKEIVHHIDGNRYNNHLNNLQLFNNTREHLNFHRKNKNIISHAIFME